MASKVICLNRVLLLLPVLYITFASEPHVITRETNDHTHLHHYRGQNHQQMHLLNTTRSQQLFAALKYIENIQNLPACATAEEYYLLGFGGGGFCSQFQSLSSQFMYGLRIGDFHHPVLLGGHFRGYSENEFCHSYGSDWLCYFQPPSTCQNELKSKGRQLPTPSNVRPPQLSQAVPEQFRALGTSFWWGAVQFFLFQPRPFIDAYLDTTAMQSFHSSNGMLKVFPSHVPVAGLHIRHGDKKDDNWQLYSLSDALALVEKSNECQVKNKDNVCFIVIEFHPVADPYGNSQRVYNWLKQAVRGYTVILPLSSIDNYHREGSKSQTASLSVPHTQLQAAMKVYEKSESGLFPATDSTIQQYNKQWVLPLEIFVSSDDAAVLSEVAKQHLWYFSPGVSQSTGQVGMEKTLASAGENSNIAVNATQEIIRDVYYLSQCSTLIGSASSQVFRMAVAFANVTGTLQHAAAIDKAQIAQVQTMSDFVGVPFPEDL